MSTSTPQPEVAGSPLRRTLGLLRPHLPGQRTLVAGGSLALVLEVIFRVLEPWPIKVVVDAVSRSLGADIAGDGPEASLTLLVAAALATISLVGLRAVCNYLATLAYAVAGSRIATRLRQRAFDHVTALSAGQHARMRSADVVQRLVGDVAKLQEVAVTAGLPLLVNVVTLVVMGGVMLWLDPLLALVVLLASVVFALVSRTSTAQITDASRRTRRSEGELAGVAQESVGALRVVQAYRLEGQLSRTFAGSNATALRDGVRSRRLAAGLERSTDVIVGVATAAVIVLGGWRVLQQAMTPGDLVLFLTYLKTAMKPLRDIAKYTGRISRATASGERVADLLDERPELVSPPDPVVLGRVLGDLRLEGVDAGHGGDPVLHRIDLDVPAGQRVALVGPSGAGKSTLVALLARLADPSAGSVRLDGHDLRDVELDRVRREVTMVLQDSVLFTGTIADNIRHGRPDASDAQVRAAAEQAQAHDFVMDQPDGYDTVVGERGSTLSGGQRQRIAIARAILRDSAVVVLDEATTGLDPVNAAAVREGLDRLTARRTTIVVTHDEATARACDRIVWVEDGRIRWDGRPDQPLPEGSAFRDASPSPAGGGAGAGVAPARTPPPDVADTIELPAVAR